MIIEKPSDVTPAVVAEMHRTPNPRTREILESLVRHLHAFVMETRLTEREFQEGIRLINWIGQKTTPSHNEAMLMAGALGVSNLVALINNGAGGTMPTQANNLGPFWRSGAPHLANGASLLKSATPGEPLFFEGVVRDAAGKPIEGVEVDVWHSSPVGLYENQDSTQAEMNLRGVFVTDAAGRFAFRSIKPGAYPVPKDGPNGVLLGAQNRHNMRPAHLHFMFYKPGWKTIASQVYTGDDPYLETDSQFGVTRALIGNYVKHANEPAPAQGITGVWWTLAHAFTLEPGEARRPQPPISAKVDSGTAAGE